MEYGKKWPMPALAALAFALFGSTAANAASFDCAMASSRIDNAICASSKVSQLDSDLHDAYAKALTQASDAEALKAAQRTWLKTTRNACQDEACLISVYQQRIAALTGSAAVASVNATPTAANQSSAATPIAQQDTTAPATQPTTTPVAEPATTNALPPATVPTTPAAQPIQIQQQPATAPIEAPKQSVGSASSNDTLNFVIGLLFIGAVVYGLITLIRRKSKKSADVTTNGNEAKESSSAKATGDRAKSLLSSWRELSTAKKVMVVIGVLFVIGAIAGKSEHQTERGSTADMTVEEYAQNALQQVSGPSSDCEAARNVIQLYEMNAVSDAKDDISKRRGIHDAVATARQQGCMH